jgi:peptide/nickel transport system substrate-binding protein
MKHLLSATALVTMALGLATSAHARDFTVAALNIAPFLDPARDHSNVGQQFYHNAFDTLILKDPTTTDRVWQPGLATEWKLVSPTTMELKLRQGVKFHNGATMTADDVIFSLNRMFQATFPPYVVRAKDRFANFDRAEKVDENTILVHSRRPEPLWETLLNLQQLAIVPEAYIAGLSGDANVVEDSDYEAFSMAPVGTGPYRIAEFVPQQRVVYERFADFWGEAAPLERVNVISVPEVSARLTALRTGEADIATNIAPDQLATVEGDPALKAEGAATALFHMLILNQNHPKLRDPRIRQALILGVDRNLLNEALWLGKAIVPDSHTMAEFGEMYMPELKTFTYDPERAKALLAEAGYDGSEITFDTQGSYYTNGFLAAQAITEMWSAIGVKASVRDLPSWTGGDPTMMTRNWSNPMYFTDPVGSFGVMWAPGGPSEGEGRFNTDAAYAEVWDRFRFSEKTEDRKAAYAELMEISVANPAFMPLYRPYESWAMRRQVNWKPQPGNIPYVLDFRAGSISFAD